MIDSAVRSRRQLGVLLLEELVHHPCSWPAHSRTFRSSPPPTASRSAAARQVPARGCWRTRRTGCSSRRSGSGRTCGRGTGHCTVSIIPRVTTSSRSSMMSGWLFENRRPIVGNPIAASGRLSSPGGSLLAATCWMRNWSYGRSSFGRAPPSRGTCRRTGTSAPPRGRPPWSRRAAHVEPVPRSP